MAARRKGDIPAEKLASIAAAEVLRREHSRGQEFGGRLTQPTPDVAAMLCHCRQNALTVIAGAGRMTRSRQRGAQRATAWMAEAHAEDAVSAEVQPWASSRPVLG